MYMSLSRLLFRSFSPHPFTQIAHIIHLDPSGPTQKTAVQQVIATLSLDNMKNDLANLTTYNNRYYRSATGSQASNDLLTKLQSVSP